MYSLALTVFPKLVILILGFFAAGSPPLRRTPHSNARHSLESKAPS